MKLELITGASLATLKFFAMGGPIAILMGGLGGLLFGVTLFTSVDRLDAALAVAGLLIVLAFVEFMLARRFDRYRKDEKADRLALGEQLVALNKANLDAMLIQVQGVGAEYDSMLRKMKELIRLAEERGPRIEELERQMVTVLAGLKELEAWHERLASRVGTLR
jgi:Na+/phosphate symporter